MTEFFIRTKMVTSEDRYLVLPNGDELYIGNVWIESDIDSEWFGPFDDAKKALAIDEAQVDDPSKGEHEEINALLQGVNDG